MAILLVPKQSLRYCPKQRHPNVTALQTFGMNVKSFLELETTATWRTRLLAIQTDLHNLYMFQLLSSHKLRREDYLLHHVYHQSVAMIYSLSTFFSEGGF